MNKNIYAYLLLMIIAICAVGAVSAVSEGYKLVTVENIELEIPEELNLVECCDDNYEYTYGNDVDYYSDSNLNYSVLIFGDDKNTKQFLKDYLSNFNKDNNYTKISDSGLPSSYYVFKQTTSSGDFYHIVFVIKELDDNEYKIVEIIGKDLKQVKQSALTTKYVDD